MPPVKTADGTQLAVKDWGKGESILFLSGWSLSSDIWNYNMPALVDAGYRCIAYDRRGHGKSSDPGFGYDYDTLVEDLATVINELDLRGVTLVAHSAAGGEAYRYLRKHGDARIKRAVAIAPIAPFLVQTDDNPHGVPESYLAAGKAQIAEDYPKWLDDNSEPFVTKDTSQGIRRWITNIMLETSMKAVLDLQTAFAHTDFRQDIKAVKIPMLHIHGDKDASVPLPFGQATAAMIPTCKLVVYEGAPHCLIVTHHQRLNADILAFMRA